MTPEDSQLPFDREQGGGIDSPSGGAFRKLVFYGSSRAVSQGLISIRGIVLASLLGPGQFGLWALFRLAMLYGSFAPLAVFRGLELEVAQASSNQNEDDARGGTASRTAFGLTLLLSGALAFAAFGASFLVTEDSWIPGMRIFAAVLILESLIVYGLTYLRASGDLRQFGVLEAVFALVHLALSVMLAIRWGLNGALLGYLLATVLLLPLMLRQVPLRPEFSTSEASRLLRVGFPVALTSMLGFALVGVDRLVVGAYAGMTQLGLYAFAISVSGLTASLAWVVRTVVMPEVYASVRIDGTSEAVRQHFRGTIVPFSQLYPVVVGVLAIAVGPAVALLLPQYLDAVPAARVVIFLGVTAGFVSLGSLGVVAAGRQRVLLVLSAIVLVVNAVLSYLALRLGFGIEGVAVGTFFSRSAFGVAILAVNANSAQLEGEGMVMVRVALPLVWCQMAVFVVDRWLGGTDLRSSALALGAYVILVSPLLPGAIRWLRQARG